MYFFHDILYAKIVCVKIAEERKCAAQRDNADGKECNDIFAEKIASQITLHKTDAFTRVLNREILPGRSVPTIATKRFAGISRCFRTCAVKKVVLECPGHPPILPTTFKRGRIIMSVPLHRWKSHGNFGDRFPYERQIDDHSCGAASLTMIYRYNGLAIRQETVLRETGGSKRAVRLAAHAREKGFRAIAVRLNEAWEGLLSIRKTWPDCGIVLNHRLMTGVAYGHYSVVVDVERDRVVLHDPMFGPHRRWMPETLEKLWEKPGGEIIGKVALLIRRSETARNFLAVCPKCGTINDLSPFREIVDKATVYCAACDKPLG